MCLQVQFCFQVLIFFSFNYLQTKQFDYISNPIHNGTNMNMKRVPIWVSKEYQSEYQKSTVSIWVSKYYQSEYQKSTVSIWVSK